MKTVGGGGAEDMALQQKNHLRSGQPQPHRCQMFDPAWIINLSRWESLQDQRPVLCDPRQRPITLRIDDTTKCTVLYIRAVMMISPVKRGASIR